MIDGSDIVEEEKSSECETTAELEDLKVSDWESRVENEEISAVVDDGVSEDPSDDSVTDLENKLVADVDDFSSEYEDDWDEIIFVDSVLDSRVLECWDSENDVDGASDSDDTTLDITTDDENDSEAGSLEVSTVDEVTGSDEDEEPTVDEEGNSVIDELSISEDEEGIGVEDGTWTT